MAGRGVLSRARPHGAPSTSPRLRGVEIAYKPEILPRAKISVFGESKQRPGIMFILDCSGSMGQPVDQEQSRVAAKLDVARNALCNVLDLLAARQGRLPRGHDRLRAPRLGKRRVHAVPVGEILTRNPNNLNELVPVAKLNPPNPALLNLQPDTDIEVLDLPGGAVAPLTEKRVEEIKARLDKLNNMGRTPLYRAIMEAVDQLNSDRESEQKHIIVLTDGVNEQNARRIPQHVRTTPREAQPRQQPPHPPGYRRLPDQAGECPPRRRRNTTR